jgi:uncharacterized protein
MRIDHHDLHHEFPEFKERISALKVSDTHFAKLFNEYDGVDKEIRHLEEANSPTSDAHLETLKLKRVHLKDQLYHRLTA